jgi:hypothetical protein
MEVKTMKRAIAGMLLLVGLSVAPVFAEDRSRDARRDQDRFEYARPEVRQDRNQDQYRYNGSYAARSERRERQRGFHDVNRDRRELNWDRR